MGSLEQRIDRLEERLRPADPRFQLLTFPTQQAYELAKARGEIVGPARVYIGVDLEQSVNGFDRRIQRIEQSLQTLVPRDGTVADWTLHVRGDHQHADDDAECDRFTWSWLHELVERSEQL